VNPNDAKTGPSCAEDDEIDYEKLNGINEEHGLDATQSKYK